jgi:hypothetical protein
MTLTPYFQRPSRTAMGHEIADGLTLGKLVVITPLKDSYGCFYRGAFNFWGWALYLVLFPKCNGFPQDFVRGAPETRREFDKMSLLIGRQPNFHGIYAIGSRQPVKIAIVCRRRPLRRDQANQQGLRCCATSRPKIVDTMVIFQRPTSPMLSHETVYRVVAGIQHGVG